MNSNRILSILIVFGTIKFDDLAHVVDLTPLELLQLTKPLILEGLVWHKCGMLQR